MRIEGFKTTAGEICFTSALVNIMEYYGCTVTEDEIVCGVSGLSIYSGVDSDNDFVVGCTDIKRDFNDYKKYLLKKGFALMSRNYSDINEVYEIVQELICNGLPCLVCCDIYELEYHEEYQRNHNIHIVTVTGFGDEGAYISDGVASSSRTRVFSDFVFNFKNSLDLSFITSEHNTVWSLEVLKHNNYGFSCNEVIVKLVKDSLNLHMNNELTNGFDYGLKAIDNLISYVEGLRRKLDEEATYRAIYILYSMISTMGGPHKVRRLISNQVDIVDKCYKIGCNELTTLYRDLSEMWKIAAIYLLKAVLTKKTNTLDKTLEKLSLIRQKEVNAASLLNSTFSEFIDKSSNTS